MSSDDGFRHLAAAVLVRAIKDANFQPDEPMSREERASVRKCAQEFLRPEHPLFEVYCGLLGWEPDAVAEGAKRRGRLMTDAARRSDRRTVRQGGRM